MTLVKKPKPFGPPPEAFQFGEADSEENIKFNEKQQVTAISFPKMIEKLSEGDFWKNGKN